MIDAGHFAGCTIVMAHPDDEVLWASSILARAGRIVLVFGDVGSRPSISEGRRRAMAEFPLPGLVWLAVPESETYNSAAWPDPAEAEAGLALRRRSDSMRGWSEARYRANFAELGARLRPHLADATTVITHNPWGEYGHEEHVQLFRVLDGLQAELPFEMWVSGHGSNRSAGLMMRWLPRLGTPSAALPTDGALAAQLKALYQRHGCWTWTDDYVWPASECFFRWPGGRDCAAPLGTVWPINIVWRDLPGPEPTRRRPAGLLARLRRRVRRLWSPRSRPGPHPNPGTPPR